MANNFVQYAECLKSTFNSITHDPNTLYFIKDTGEIYKGDVLYSGGGSGGTLVGDDINIEVDNGVIKAIVPTSSDIIEELFDDGLVDPIADIDDSVLTDEGGSVITY